MRAHAGAVKAALEEIASTAGDALVDLEGIEARIDEGVIVVHAHEARSKRWGKMAAVIGGTYLAVSAVAARADGPMQAVPGWTLDTKVHLITRTDAAVDAFARG